MVRERIAVFGNCQAREIGRVLSTHPPFAQRFDPSRFFCRSTKWRWLTE